MKLFATTLCLIGATVALSACGTSHHSGASYANERTAGEMEASAPVVRQAPAERVFREVQTK